jgi:hypothetical protein
MANAMEVGRFFTIRAPGCVRDWIGDRSRLLPVASAEVSPDGRAPDRTRLLSSGETTSLDRRETVDTGRRLHLG